MQSRSQQGLVVADLDRSRHRERRRFYRRADGPRAGRGRRAVAFSLRPEDERCRLYEAGYNRVYDTLEPETNLDFVERIVAQILKLGRRRDRGLAQTEPRHRQTSQRECEGTRNSESAYERDVPVFVPAFSDSEMGLDFALHNRMRRKTICLYCVRSVRRSGVFCRNTAEANAARDLHHWRRRAAQLVTAVRTVHRIAHRRGGEDIPLKRYHYGLRICPEPVYWEGLSSSPYSEAVSWGEFVPKEEGGKFDEVFVDATVGLPLIVGAVLERLKK